MRYTTLLISFIIISFIGILYTVTGGELFSIQNLHDYLMMVRSFVQQHSVLSIIAYLLLYTAISGLSLPGATGLTLAGGALFGIYQGTIYALLGATCGATVAFLVVRSFFGKTLKERYKNTFSRFYTELRTKGGYYLLTARLIPFIPFFLINILAALTPISLRTFVLTTFIGIIPGTLLYTYTGQHISAITSFKDIVTPKYIALFSSIALVVLMLRVLSFIVQKRKW